MVELSILIWTKPSVSCLCLSWCIRCLLDMVPVYFFSFCPCGSTMCLVCASRFHVSLCERVFHVSVYLLSVPVYHASCLSKWFSCLCESVFHVTVCACVYHVSLFVSFCFIFTFCLCLCTMSLVCACVPCLLFE